MVGRLKWRKVETVEIMLTPESRMEFRKAEKKLVLSNGLRLIV